MFWCANAFSIWGPFPLKVLAEHRPIDIGETGPASQISLMIGKKLSAKETLKTDLQEHRTKQGLSSLGYRFRVSIFAT